MVTYFPTKIKKVLKKDIYWHIYIYSIIVTKANFGNMVSYKIVLIQLWSWIRDCDINEKNQEKKDKDKRKT